MVQIDDATDTMILGVFDGHGEHGNRCSQYVKRELPLRLIDHSLWAQDVASVLKDVSAQIGEAMAGDIPGMDTTFSGATCTCVVIRHGVLYILHIGACRAVLASREPPPFHTWREAPPTARREATASSKVLKGTPLTEDHCVGVPRERRRIEQAGGRAFSVRYNDGTTGPMRLWMKSMDLPGLSVSRSFGDKIGLLHGGLSSEAETGLYELSDYDDRGDSLVILATDGLWMVCSNDEAAHIASRVIADSHSRDPLISLSSAIAEALVGEAQHRWLNGPERRSDDITVVVALLCGGRQRMR